MAEPVARPGTSAWGLLTTHAQVLLCLRGDPSMRQREIADRVGVTERRVGTVVDDLIDAGYLERTRVGRRNTYRLRTDLPLPHQLHQQRRIGDVIDAVGGVQHLDRQDVLDTGARNVVELIGDGCLIAMVEPRTGQLEPLAVRHQDPAIAAELRRFLEEDPTRTGSGISGRVAARGEPVLLPALDLSPGQTMMSPQTAAVAERLGMRGMAVVPLIVDGETVGTLGVFRTRPEPPLTPADVELLGQLAEQAALALRSAGAEHAVGVEAFEAFFHASSEGALVATPAGRLLAVNEAACTMLRGTADQICAEGWRARTGTDDQSDLDRAGWPGGGAAIVQLRRCDGTTVDAQVRAARFTTAGGEPRTCLIIKPVGA
jgi:PAS domain-containing protein